MLRRFSALLVSLLFAVPASHEALAASIVANEPLRICTDLRGIRDADWYPTVSDEKGDPFATEVAIDLAFHLTLTNPDISFLGIAQTYEAIAPDGSLALHEVLRAKYFLRALVTPVRQDGQDGTIIRIWLENTASGQLFLDTGPVFATESDTASSFADLLAQLVTDKKLTRSSKSPRSVEERDKALLRARIILSEFKLDSWPAHVALAKCRTNRLMGRRFGDPSEENRLSVAESYLKEVKVLRGERAPSRFEQLEELALLLRIYNFSETKDARWTRKVRDVETVDENLGAVFPQLYLWQGIGRSFQVLQGDANQSFDFAIRTAPSKYDNGYFNRGFFNDTNGVKTPSPAEDFRQASLINPTHLRAASYLAKAEVSKSRDKSNATFWRSIGAFDKIREIRKYPLALFLKAQILWVSNDPAKKRETLDKALSAVDEVLSMPELYPEDAQLLKMRILFDLRDWKAVEENLLSSLPQRQWGWFADDFRKALQADKSETKQQFSELRARLEVALGYKPSISPLEYALLGLLAAHAGDEDAAEFAGSSSLIMQQASGEDDFRAYSAVARTYAVLGNKAAADAIASTKVFEPLLYMRSPNLYWKSSTFSVAANYLK